MATDDEASRRAGEYFRDHIASRSDLDNIADLVSSLPNDPEVLRRIAARCTEEFQRSFRAGHHTEVRRFGILARQLRDLAGQS